MTSKQLTRIGLFHIEEAILDTLFQAGDEYVRAADNITGFRDLPVLGRIALDSRYRFV